MDSLLREYLPILIFLGIAVGMALTMVTASYIVARQKPDSEKESPYECGFAPFNDARRQFDVRFYLVAILFIIFDLEVAFLFPWAVSLGAIGMVGFWSMMIFLGILTLITNLNIYIASLHQISSIFLTIASLHLYQPIKGLSLPSLTSL